MRRICRRLRRNVPPHTSKLRFERWAKSHAIDIRVIAAAKSALIPCIYCLAMDRGSVSRRHRPVSRDGLRHLVNTVDPAVPQSSTLALLCPERMIYRVLGSALIPRSEWPRQSSILGDGKISYTL